MQYYDQHMHTYFSPDSQERFENYLALSDKPLITTEHMDYFSPDQAKDDVIPDYEGYCKTIDQLNATYQNRLLKGIEIGYTKDDVDKINAFMKDKDYDLVLLSIHHNGHYNFMKVSNRDVPLARTLDHYYDLMLEGVRALPFANVLAHFDYGLRSYDVSVADLKTVENQLLTVFEAAAQNELAFELNTKSMYQHGNFKLYDYAIDLYKEAGGRLFTIGSDAHKVADYEGNFEDAFNMLKNHDVSELVVYQKRQAIPVEIPKLLFPASR
ncbi:MULTISPECIES: hypothetical protein [unclassified Jeotgalibaca]|uniref:hypothetical protein n=1 Tax=unclassified Jeotgalibaca TaxID=2621505 RepID=UPI003FD01337